MNSLAPASSREVSSLLRELHAQQRRVRIQGLGTRARLVAPLPEGATTLSLRSLCARTSVAARSKRATSTR